MKRIVYMPAGRALWVDLAERLEAEGVATPVVWLGDARHEARAAERFPGAEVLPLNRLYFGDLSGAPSYRGELAGFLTSEAFARAKERGGKMLDRLDRDGVLKAPSREAYMTAMALWAMSVFARTKPEALVMAENPHAAATYLIYELCQWLGLPSYSFTAWSFIPGVSLREGIWGPMRPAPDAARGAFDATADALIDSFAAKLADPAPEASAPDYMRAQERRERKWRVPAKLLGALRGGGKPRALKGLFAGDAVSRAAYGSRAAVRVERTDALRAALAAAIVPDVSAPFVFVPLHYEPERTTNPDGGDFHDQIRMLAVLRALLPDGVAIRVKEHPSQLMLGMKGFLGRSPGFYAAVSAIEGVSFAPMEVPSRVLMDASLGVATVTGTAALEAAVLGKPALVFGAPWFEGCPNVTRWTPGLADPFAGPVSPAPEVVAWLKARWRAVGMFGSVNPSNEKLRKDYYTPDVYAAELAAVSAALSETLGAS